MSVFEVSRLRAGIVNALEAIEDGDTGYATAILLALDDAPESAARIGCPPAHVCSCGLSFEWPGLLSRHEIVSGHVHDVSFGEEASLAA